MPQEIVYKQEAREGIKKGVDALANAVKVTLGARGRNVILTKPFSNPQITKDGVSVAKQVEMNDPLENTGAQMVKEVASRTNDLAGDGTTTATVLAQSIVDQGLRNVAAGANPLDLQKGMNIAVEAIVEELDRLAIDVGSSTDMIKQVASISANNDHDIGTLISEAYKIVGKNGVITVEESPTRETYTDVAEGMQFNRSYLSPLFITDEPKMQAELENPLVLITDEKIESVEQLRPILEPVFANNRPILIIADEIKGEALATLVLNKIRGGRKICAVKAPEFGYMQDALLEDIAQITGGTVVSQKFGYNLEDIGFEVLGEAGSIIVDKDKTIIIEGKGDPKKIQERINLIKEQIKEETNVHEKEELIKRLAKISSGVGILFVGAASELEMKEKKDRVEDALHATKAAIEEGIVAGGGIALIRAKQVLNNLKYENIDQKTGIDIISKAVEAPLRTIVDNAGREGSVVVEKVIESHLRHGEENFGYDVKTEKYVDMLISGIVDPKKVTRIALENAASVGGVILTTECVLIETKEE